MFPFPNKRLKELAKTVKKFVVVEINMGQMIRDVRLAINGEAEVELINKPVGAPIDVDTIVEKVMRLI